MPLPLGELGEADGALGALAETVGALCFGFADPEGATGAEEVLPECLECAVGDGTGTMELPGCLECFGLLEWPVGEAPVGAAVGAAVAEAEPPGIALSLATMLHSPDVQVQIVPAATGI